MNIKQLIAVGALAVGFSSCNLLGNAVQGGPAFSGVVATTPPAGVPAASSYKLALVRFTDFGNPPNTVQAAAFATTIAINGGTGAYSGFLAPAIDLNGDARRFYKVAVYDDKNNDDKYDTSAAGTQDVVLADSIAANAPGGRRFFVYSNADDLWTTGKILRVGWNLVSDPTKNSSVTTDLGRGDDTVTQAGGFGGIDITYP